MKKIFISYKRSNKDRVFKIVEDIRLRTGIDCWIDLSGIESGDWFENTIIRAINECDIMLFMLSREAIAVPTEGMSWTQKEVKYALTRGKRVIPILIDDSTVNDCDWLCFNCGGLDRIDYRNVEQWEKLLNNLSTWCGKTLKAGTSDTLFSTMRFSQTNKHVAVMPATNKKYDLILIRVGNERLPVFKAMKETCGLELHMAKLYADECPTVIKTGMPREEAETARKKINSAGAKVQYVEGASVDNRHLDPNTERRLIDLRKQVALELSEEAQSLEGRKEYEKAAEIYHKAIRIGMSIPNYDYDNFSYDCKRAAWINENIIKNDSYASFLYDLGEKH